MFPAFKIVENSAPSARLFNSAVSLRRRAEMAPPPEIALKAGFFGVSNTAALCAGIGLAALILIPLGAFAARGKIKEIWMRFQTPVVVEQAVPRPAHPAHPALPAPTPLAIPPVKKIALPAIKAEMFNVTSILLGGAAPIAVINGKACSVGDQVPVAGEPGWKLARILEDRVVLDYFGNPVAVMLNLALAPKPFHDELNPLQ